jgi:hypothetical protein
MVLSCCSLPEDDRSSPLKDRGLPRPRHKLSARVEMQGWWDRRPAGLAAPDWRDPGPTPQIKRGGPLVQRQDGPCLSWPLYSREQSGGLGACYDKIATCVIRTGTFLTGRTQHPRPLQQRLPGTDTKRLLCTRQSGGCANGFGEWAGCPGVAPESAPAPQSGYSHELGLAHAGSLAIILSPQQLPPG